MLHLHSISIALAFVLFLIVVLASQKASPMPQTLVTFVVWFFELQVCRWPWPDQNCDPIAPGTALIKRPVLILLTELLGGQVLSGRLSSLRQKQMICQERDRIEEGQDPVKEHGEGHSIEINCSCH